ncbi:MAG: carbohydrate kinase [Ardenticatenaceae bacterium]|nr:carbohydrate kinase [Ardenticatenaceae bacterium]
MNDPQSTVDVLCVGQAPYDLTFTIDRHPQPDEKMFATALHQCGGGPAANAAVAVARLGHSSAFAGYLGQDAFGDLHFQELVADDVQTSLIVRGTVQTPLSVSLVKLDGSRALVNYGGNQRPLPAHSIDFSHCHPRVIIFDGWEPDISPPLAQWARQAGIPTILDAGSVHRGTEALAPLVDYLIGAEKFGRTFTGEADPVRAAAKLSELGGTAVIITLGSQGLVWQKGGESGHLPAFPVETVDTTGAGDAFHGAFAAGLVRGLAWNDLLRFASAVAALTCTKMSARLAIPEETAVQKFLEKSGNRVAGGG